MLTLERDLNSALSANVGANYSRQDYESLGSQFSDHDREFGHALEVRALDQPCQLDYEYLDRSDDASTAEYSANEFWVRFGYLVGEGAAGVSSRDCERPCGSR